MRLLYLINNFDFGGAENHVRDLANAMDDLGNEVFIIARKGMQINRLNKRVKFISMEVSDVLSPLQIIYICFFLRRNKIDIIHAHKRLPIFLASVAGKIMNIPVIATVHGKTRHDLRSMISKEFPDKIIFVSKRTIDANSNDKKIFRKSVFIQNGVEVSETNNFRDYYSICYISRVDRRHSSLIKLILKEVLPGILKEYPGVTFRIIGDGECMKALKNEAASLNSRAKREICIVHGYIPEVRKQIEKSGMVIGVGRSAMEALSCSVPVLSVNNKFMGKFVSKENYNIYQQNNFVAVGNDPPDPVKLRELLIEYFKDPEIKQAEARIIQDFIKNDLSMRKISSEILELYREVYSSKKIAGGKKEDIF